MDIRPMELQQPDVQTAQTILVVDDHLDSMRSTRQLLEADGHRVLTATEGERALHILAQRQPDVLVVALSPMTAGGYELIRRARAIDTDLPVIMEHDGLDVRSRRQLIRNLDLHGVHHRHGEPAHLLELVESALAGLRRVRRARTTEELRSLILAKLCHELRASLGTIQGYAEILQVEHPGASTAEILSRLAAASSTATELAQRYLMLAQLDDGRVCVQREPVAIATLVEDLRLFAERRIGARPIRLDFRVNPGSKYIDSDGEKLRAILTELVANAVKFCPEGEICLAVRRTVACTEFELTDTGPGIQHAELRELLSPFCQSSDREVPTTPGQGLGLAIAVRLSALIGAALTAASGEPSGARFTLTVPAPLTQRGAAVTVH